VPYVSKAASILGTVPPSRPSSRRRSTSLGSDLDSPIDGASDDITARTEAAGAFTMIELDQCMREMAKDPVFRLAQTVLSRSSMAHVLESRKIVIEDTMGGLRAGKQMARYLSLNDVSTFTSSLLGHDRSRGRRGHESVGFRSLVSFTDATHQEIH
jgi:hypothetical protein